MLFKAALACKQAVYSRQILASTNHRDFLMELAFQVIYISLVAPCLVTGSIRENIDVLITKLGDAGSKKQQQHFEAIISVGNYLIENGPLVQTQQIAKRYKGFLYLIVYLPPDCYNQSANS